MTKRGDDEKEMEGVDDGRGRSVFLWSAIVTEKRLFNFESASGMCCYHLKVLCKSVEPSLICLIPTSFAMSTFIRDKPRFSLTALWVKPEPASDEKL